MTEQQTTADDGMAAGWLWKAEIGAMVEGSRVVATAASKVLRGPATNWSGAKVAVAKSALFKGSHMWKQKLGCGYQLGGSPNKLWERGGKVRDDKDECPTATQRQAVMGSPKWGL